MGRAGGQPGPHTGEFLSPLERKHFVSHSSVESKKLNLLVCQRQLTPLMGLKEPLDKRVKIEEEELQREDRGDNTVKSSSLFQEQKED